MKKKLIAYQLSGQTLGIDITSWSVSDLNNNQPFKTIIDDEVIPDDYLDITTIENWYRFGIDANCDHMSIKYGIVDIVIVKKWSGLTSSEKDIVIKYFAYVDEVDAFLYLVYEKGMSFENAKMFLVKSWHEHHRLLIDCYRERWYQVKLIVATFISFANAQDLFNHANMLIYSYSEAGVVGRNYGDNVDGLLDFIESTNTFTGNGLRERGYDVYENNWNFFINELKNVLVFGIYNSKY